MRLISSLILIGFGAVIGTYFPMTAYLPEKAIVGELARENVPVVGEMLFPEEEEEDIQEEAEIPETEDIVEEAIDQEATVEEAMDDEATSHESVDDEMIMTEPETEDVVAEDEVESSE